MNTAYYEYGVVDYTAPRRSGGAPGLRRHRLRVEIISESPTRTKIRFLEFHVDGRGPGTIANVKSRNVHRIGSANLPAVSYRLPYADD